MKTSAIILSFGALVAGTLPVGAQQWAREGGNPAPVEHAQLGLLEAVGVGNNRIIIALPGAPPPGMAERPYDSYDTNAETLVEGLGSVTQVSSALAPYVGNLVVVTFVEHNEHFVAKRLDFSADRVIRETHGTIRSIDPRTRVMVIRNAQGRDETMHLGSGPGATIDSNTGLLKISDLRAGQQVFVYFGAQDRARLLRIG